VKRKVAQWIGGGLLSTISILIYLILFQTHLFSDIILNAVYKYVLSDSDISIHGDLQGGLLGKSVGMDTFRIEVNDKDEPLFRAAAVSVFGWDWDWSNRELTLQKLLIDEYSVHAENVPSTKSSDEASPPQVSTIIQEIRAEDGEISFGSGDSTQTVMIPQIHSTVWYIDGFMDTKIHSAVAVAPSLVISPVTRGRSALPDILK